MATCDRCGVSLYYPNNIIDKESVCTSCFQKEKEKMFEDTDSKEVKRELEADLKLCNKATQGPWEHRYNSEFSEIYANNSNASVAIVGHNPYDAEFIAQAREGWPHAIERAIKAEALARELVATLKKAHEYIGDINSFYGQGLQVYGWHLNGAPEPLDNFIDSNGGCEAEEFVGRVLTKAKEVLGDDN